MILRQHSSTWQIYADLHSDKGITVELSLTEDALLRLSFLKGVACGREDGKVAE